MTLNPDYQMCVGETYSLSHRLAVGLLPPKSPLPCLLLLSTDHVATCCLCWAEIAQVLLIHYVIWHLPGGNRHWVLEILSGAYFWNVPDFSGHQVLHEESVDTIYGCKLSGHIACGHWYSQLTLVLTSRRWLEAELHNVTVQVSKLICAILVVQLKVCELRISLPNTPGVSDHLCMFFTNYGKTTGIMYIPASNYCWLNGSGQQAAEIISATACNA